MTKRADAAAGKHGRLKERQARTDILQSAHFMAGSVDDAAAKNSKVIYSLCHKHTDLLRIRHAHDVDKTYMTA